MSDNVNRHQDRLVEHALALLQDDLHEEPDAAVPRVPHPEQADLIGDTLNIMRATTVMETKTAGATPPTDKLTSSQSRLDMERADMRRRVEIFKATQQRFQREREEYCTDALAAAQAGEWKPLQP